jgi:Zn-dependent protease
MERLPLIWGTYSIADEASVPADTRRAFEDVFVELAGMGFVPAGYLQSANLAPDSPWFRAVLWNSTEKAFATLTFRPASRPLGLAIDFVTLFEDDAWVWTEQGRQHMFIGNFTSGQLVDTLAADVTERWELHRAAVAAEEGRRAREATLADLCAFHSARDEEEIRLGMARGDVLPTADPRLFRFTRSGALTFMRRREEGERRVATAGIGDPDLSRVPLDEQERHYRTAAHVEELTKSRTWGIFALSAIAFAASMLLWTSWSVLAWIIPVLLFHEFGHWAAMRLLGHRDAWIAFIPFFGAATISGKRFDKLSHELIVLLAGPVPGIVLGVALMVLSIATRHHSSFLVQLAAMLVGLNVVNLLPLHPLDGGRILHALVTAGRPRVSLVLKGLATAAFVAAAIGMRDPTMALLAAFTGFALWQDIKRARIEGEIRRAPGFTETTSAEARRRFIFEALKSKPEGAPAHWLANVRLLEVPLSHTRPGRVSALIAGVVYVGFFGAAWFGVTRIASWKMDGMHCPDRSAAIALSCDAPTLPADAWSKLPPPARLRRTSLASESASFPVAAFVWCDLPDESSAARLASRLGEAAINGREYCTALPWETTDDGIPEALHERSRSTLAELRRATFTSDDDGLAAVDAIIAGARDRTDFDADIARMYRTDLTGGMTSEMEKRVGDRLGRSPTRSCDRIRLAQVESNRPLWKKRLHVETGQSEPQGPPGVRFSVRVGRLEDFAPLGAYMCQLGCRVQVLPIAADDTRIRFCF